MDYSYQLIPWLDLGLLFWTFLFGMLCGVVLAKKYAKKIKSKQ